MPAEGPPGMAAATGAWVPSLSFEYSPSDHPLRAEMDAATIYATLPPPQLAQWDMYIYLLSSNGSLDPIVIPKGDNIGQTKLVAGQPAQVTVKYRASTPWANPVSGLPLQIAFGSPVAALSMRVNPPQIGLFETAEIDLQLVDAKGLVVPTDEKRQLWVTVASGSGQLEKTELSIDSKGARASTYFVPTLPGTVTLSAWSSNLPEVRTTLVVSPPTLVLALCAVGGALGGLLAYWNEKRAPTRRIVIGLITGFVFYWALLFGVVHLPGFPHAFVLNPASVVMLSLLGGWGGTKSITAVLRQFGLDW